MINKRNFFSDKTSFTPKISPSKTLADEPRAKLFLVLILEIFISNSLGNLIIFQGNMNVKFK